MNQRILGRTGIAVSEIGVGAWQLGGPLKLDGRTDGHPDLGQACVIDLIRRCGDLGINFIDTAEQYGAGESERRVGMALQGQRDRWIVSTKFGAMVGPRGERINDASAARIPLSLEGSLRRLRTDHIDVYVYHVAPGERDAEAAAHVLESAKRKGLIRAAGISTNNLGHIRLLQALGCLDVVQFSQNLLSPQEEIVSFLNQHNVGGVVRGAFAGGRLSGRYFRQPPQFAPDDIRSNSAPPGSPQAADFARYAVFEELLQPGRSMVQLALRYLLDFPTTHTIILGAKGIDDYAQAAAATALPPLTPAEHSRIAELRAALAR